MATTLSNWVTTTLTATDPNVILLGNLNAFGTEDPVDTQIQAGFEDQIAALVPASARFSIIMNGMAGYTDHALCSESLRPHVSSAIDYNEEEKSHRSIHQPCLSLCSP
jgi:hypothetical protein